MNLHRSVRLARPTSDDPTVPPRALPAVAVRIEDVRAVLTEIEGALLVTHRRRVELGEQHRLRLDCANLFGVVGVHVADRSVVELERDIIAWIGNLFGAGEAQ